MKISELKERLKKYGFTVARDSDSWLISSPNRWGVAHVNIDGSGYEISSLPIKAASVVLKFIATPIEERRDEKRWNIVVGQDVDKAGELSIWRKPAYGTAENGFIDAQAKLKNLKAPTTIFTDSEFNQLIEHLKALPHGGIYAKIAELGKREVLQND
ncbi:hypothetical protein ACUIJQ_08330 [Levilactobacillus hammesii]|uniref:Uncharacterized protein n=1 Tax=Levilactobacillus hammesii DSM 16381 TaxID=1423753 RepID=A0A0R1UQR6_9LACO|nr:hypothetical protein [Levilactobacillus hammesii]KRL95551.1 hypothetical protein FD28_GL002522 [Levilactobacillus hammesii DSM 16381]